MTEINRKIIHVLELSNELLEVGNDGIECQVDNSCGILFGILRDCAFRLQQLAEKEIELHQQNGLFDDEDSKELIRFRQQDAVH